MSNNGLADNFKSDPVILEVFTKILAVLKGPDYFDRSDSIRDYVEVSHYIRVNLGKHDKSFSVTA